MRGMGDLSERNQMKKKRRRGKEEGVKDEGKKGRMEEGMGMAAGER